MTTESYISSDPEESRNITVISPQGVINQENETRHYLNAGIEL